MTEYVELYSGVCTCPPGKQVCYVWYKNQDAGDGKSGNMMIGTEGGLPVPKGYNFPLGGNYFPVDVRGDVFVYFDGVLVATHRGIFNTAINVPCGTEISFAWATWGSEPPVHPRPKEVIKAEIKSAIGPTTPEEKTPFDFTLKWTNIGNVVTDFDIKAEIKQGLSVVENQQVSLTNVAIGTENHTIISFAGTNTAKGSGSIRFMVYNAGNLLAEITEQMDFREKEEEEPPTPPPEEPEGRSIYGYVTDKTLGTPISLANVYFEGKGDVTDTKGYYEILEPAEMSAPLTCKVFGYQDYSKIITAPVTGGRGENIYMIKSGETPPPDDDTDKPPETVEASFWSLIGGLWNLFVDTSFIIVNAAYTTMTGTPITQEVLDEWAKTGDWLLPVNFMAKALYGQSIYKNESPEITESDVIDMVLKEASWALLGGALAKIGAALVGRVGATTATTTMGKVGQLTLTGAKLRTRRYLIQGALNGIWEAIKAQPIITIFAVSEFPNLINMMVFTRQALAQEAGVDATSMNFKLADYVKAIETQGYTIRDLLKDKKYNEANTALNNLKTTLDNYQFNIEANRQKLNQMNAYDNEIALYTAFMDSYNKMREEVPYIPSEMPEHMPFKVLGITDGDTVTGKDNAGTAFIIRLSGIDAPENKTNEGKASTQYLQSLVLNKDVTLDIDPEHITDKYGRILARIMLGMTNINLEMIKKCYANFWVYEPNKYVDDKLYKESACDGGGDGEPPTPPPSEPPTEEFKILVTTEPDNAALYLDGISLHHRAPMDEEELARPPHRTISLFTVGKHKLSASKAGKTAEKEIDVVAGDNGTHHLVLGSGMVTPPPKFDPEKVLSGFTPEQLQQLLDLLLKLLGQ